MTNKTFGIVITLIIIVSVASVFTAIFMDFLLYNKKNNTKKAKKSLVATGTMILFYIGYYMILRYEIGAMDTMNRPFIILGTLMILVGSGINILGRFQLKNNWANHIKIYETHQLVNTGVYKWARHPLYGSIMMMFLGGSLVYANYLTLLATMLIFIPFMYYRAKQEEALLSKEFQEYQEYVKKTGMFFPKTRRR